MKRGMAAVALAGAIGVAVAGCSGSTKSVAGPTTTTTATVSTTATVEATVTATPTITRVVQTKTRTVTETYTPPPVGAFNDGTYEAPSDIKAGRYRTDGGSDCYYEVDGDVSGNNIIDNGDSTGPQYFSIERGQYVQVSGGCDWRRA